MSNYNKDIGNYGENLSVEYLSNLGHKVIHRNFKCKLGEIDIISKLENINCICFTEVKSRYNNLYGAPWESITYKKVRKIKAVAEFYIIKNNLKDSNFRFDMIEVFFNTTNDTYSLKLTENAF